MNAPGRAAKTFLRRNRDFLWTLRSLCPEDFRSLTALTDLVRNRCGVWQASRSGAETVCAARAAKSPRRDCARVAGAAMHTAGASGGGGGNPSAWLAQAAGRSLSGAFRVRRGWRKAAGGAHTGLLDDVLTTGATL